MKAKIVFQVVFCLVIVLNLSVFADEIWNRQEGQSDVAEYASDSGSFALVDGCEFTKIKVTVQVKDGDGGVAMTAEASISAGSYSISESVSADIGDSEWDDAYPTGTTGTSWSWEVDTRGNSGTGSAWCKWRWSCD